MKRKGIVLIILFGILMSLSGIQNSIAQSNETAEESKLTEQQLFEESLRRMMPLDDEHIKKYRARSDKRNKELSPVPPHLNSRTVKVVLEPGHSAVKVKTTANIVTALVFHDATGSPWPISSVTNGSPTFFQLLRPEVSSKNILNITPLKDYGAATLVITLENEDVPLIVSMTTDSVRGNTRQADSLVLIRVSSYGPNARPPIIKNIKETTTSTMLSFLDGIPPSNAKTLQIQPADEHLSIWKIDKSYYVRTKYDLMFPAWIAVVHGSAGMKCYELSTAPRLMVSENGNLRSITVEE